MDYRKSTQFILPAVKAQVPSCEYDIYPDHDIGSGKIGRNFNELVLQVASHRVLILDGYQGVFFRELALGLKDELLSALNIEFRLIDITSALKSRNEIEELVAPFTGGDDPLFGRKSGITLESFFDISMLERIREDSVSGPCIIHGPGASLAGAGTFLIYADLPKNEIQYRSRAGLATNLGGSSGDPKMDYKRNYFVDWLALNSHKKSLLDRMDVYVDSQRRGDLSWISGDDLREALEKLSTASFRARPWFEPGAWGGTWIRDNIRGVNREVENYAWSFELITPENGILFSSDGNILECSFDMLMYQAAEKILGEDHPRYGDEFPIRFDFLDTMEGGNLSIQCHPGPDYIGRHFGERLPQEESYYILDAGIDSSVYLGFREGTERNEFRKALIESYRTSKPADIDRYILKHPSARHDLFLIPYGTIHGSGKNNLVLEISSTPYIFTFKMYDWLRPDLDGNLRPLNIERGISSLDFSRKGSRVAEELIAKPILKDQGEGWMVHHLPTHPTQLYDILRYTIYTSITIDTGNRLMVMSLVEGTTIILEAAGAPPRSYSFAETFVIPAATGKFILTNEANTPVLVICAFPK